MPEQGIPTKNEIEGSMLDAAKGIFDLIDDDGLAAVGIEGGNENIGIPSAEREPAKKKPVAEGTDEDSDESDDFDADAASALQDDESEGEETDETHEEESDEEDSEDEANEAPAEDTDPLVTVKVDGEERQVPLSEALRGYSSTASFTRKSQALSAEKKAFEAEREAVQQERTKLDAYLRQAEELLQQKMPQEPSPDNPQAWIRYQQEMMKLQQVQYQRSVLQQQMEAEENARVQRFIAEENAKLAEIVPEWKDEKVARADKANLAKYAIGMLGFDEEDVRNIRDARTVMLLRKAYAYDQIEKKAAGMKEKVKTTKTLKPGQPSRRSTAAKSEVRKVRSKAKQLRETGRVKDAAALFEDMLGDDF